MEFKINKNLIGSQHRTYIIAELSANHNHDFDIAVKTIEAAKKAGADAIKLQTYTADTITIDSDNEHFKLKDGLWQGRTLYNLYQEAYTPWEWQPKLKQVAEEQGLDCFSSPFDFTAVDFLEKMNVPAYKIASFEITDIPLIAYAAEKGKPMIISTGIARLSDIELAVNTCKKAGNHQIALLKCTSAYPTPLNEVNLANIPTLARTFGTVIGLSDHTLTTAIPVAAVTLGARIVEKHLILDKNLGGPDAAFSLNPQEFSEMVASIRQVEEAIGQNNYEYNKKMENSRKLSKSIFVVKDIKKGETFSTENIKVIRPGYGLHPSHYYEVLKKQAAHNLEKGTALDWDFIFKNKEL